MAAAEEGLPAGQRRQRRCIRSQNTRAQIDAGDKVQFTKGVKLARIKATFRTTEEPA